LRPSLRPGCRRKLDAIQSNRQSSSNSRLYSYTKVLNNRKHPIRGLWKRNGKFVPHITMEDDADRKAATRVPLQANTAAQARERFRLLLVLLRVSSFSKRQLPTECISDESERHSSRLPGHRRHHRTDPYPNQHPGGQSPRRMIDENPRRLAQPARRLVNRM